LKSPPQQRFRGTFPHQNYSLVAHIHVPVEINSYSKYVETRNGEVVHANCWAHARRKFFEAGKYSPKECDKVLRWIAELFLIEKDLQGKPPDEVLSVRREKSTRIVYEIFEYLESLFFSSVVDKRSPLGKAIAYTRDLKEGLTVFLDHEDIPLSNNEIERATREAGSAWRKTHPSTGSG
jgi:transposase